LSPDGIHGVQPWLPLAPRVRGKADQRSPERYLEVLRQFDVETNERYKPDSKDGKRRTWCNIFVWDSTSAMGCEVPHWYDEATGEATRVGRGREMTANGMYRWLESFGPAHGWRKVGEDEAQDNANQGKPTIAAWLNTGGIGHVAMVVPGNPGWTTIAQAGRLNLFGVPLGRGFGAAKPDFWTHD
jgi:hypothetical protein